MGSAKEATNQQKHGLLFGDVTGLFTSGADYLELPDTAHDDEEERLIAIGPVARGVVMVVFTELHEYSIRMISARRATRTEVALYRKHLEGQL